MTPENLLTEWARLFVESLADAGLTDVVVSPGSRSTPLVCALLACERLRTTSVVDERSAGFFALGLARITGVPAAVVCTSGSAAANYFPAIVEAAASHTPLLVITADRPFELQDCSAPQTLDQAKIYGGHVRRFVELGMPESAHSALVAVRRRAAQSVFDAMSPIPGPVHVNVRARKPLEPKGATTQEAVELTRTVDALLKSPISRPASSRSIADDASLVRVANDVNANASGVIVCGPSPFGSRGLADAVRLLAERSGYPVYAETTSQLRFSGTESLPSHLVLDGLDLLLRSAKHRAAFRPSVVIQVGEPPTSGAFDQWLGEQSDLSRHVFAGAGWPDPRGDASSLVVADVADAVGRVAALVAPRASHPDGFTRANADAWRVVDETLATEAHLSEGSAVRAVLGALPQGALLAVGNSLPVRHVDAFCRARQGTKLAVVSQRGVSGIDGVISGSAGAARAANGPTVLVVGDVSAVHDLNGFSVAAASTVPFVIVVLDNDGGRIFEQLPLGRAGLDEERLRYWTTPHGTSFETVARLFRVAYARTTSVGELDLAVRAGLRKPGCTLVEVPVPPHGAREHYERITARIDALFGG